MELFSEIYSCYYQVLRHLLCSQNALTQQDIRSRICGEGFEESLLSIIPKLEDGTWNLLEKDGNLFCSKISSSFLTPVSNLEKSYLKALLSDPRINLFLDREQTKALQSMLSAVSPLWSPGQFRYFDRFPDGDPYEDETYRNRFRTLLKARLEYSIKNDKFRLLALKPEHPSKVRQARSHRRIQAEAEPDRRTCETVCPNTRQQERYPAKFRLEILNLSRIQSVRPLEKTLSSPVDLNAMIRHSYYREPLRLRIVNKRNALERAMLHFANYEKNTTKIDEDTYECLIYYNSNMETELLIEVMSFGPMLTVTGNDRFLSLLKDTAKTDQPLALAVLHRRTDLCLLLFLIYSAVPDPRIYRS